MSCAMSGDAIGGARRRTLSTVWDALKAGASKLSDFGQIFSDETADARRAFDLVKPFGFYTDCCGDKAHWVVPASVIDRDFANLIVTLADAITKDQHTVTSRAMELWIEHMRDGTNEESLAAWCEAAKAERLHPDGYAEDMTWVVCEGFPPKLKLQ
jgi:hypothetical protein